MKFGLLKAFRYTSNIKIPKNVIDIFNKIIKDDWYTKVILNSILAILKYIN